MQAACCYRSCDVPKFIAGGLELFAAAEATYDEKIGRVESLIISELRDWLGSSRGANDMFRVFSRFNSLFIRPKVNQIYIINSLLQSFRSEVPSKNIKMSS